MDKNSQSERDKIRFARFTRMMIRAIALILGAAFAFLQLKDVQASTVLNSSAADFIWRAALVIYYWAWVLGLTFDTNIQELAYAKFPGKGNWPIKAIGAALIFGAVAYALLRAHGNVVHFSMAMTAFLLVDHLGWLYLRHFLKSSVRRSKIEYRAQNKLYELEILRTVDAQISGTWKWWRLGAGAMIVFAADVFAFSDTLRRLSADAVRAICPWLSAEEAGSLLYSAIVLLFVLVMEVWHWALRVRTMFRLNTLESMQTRYDLVQR